MTRVCLVAAAVAALALTPGADAAHSRCPTKTLVKRTSQAVIFSRPARHPDQVGQRVYFGCLWRVKKTYRLNQVGEFGDNMLDRASIHLAGRFVSYQQDWGSGAGGPLNTVSVRDLRTGVVIHQAEASRRGADLGDRATDYALKRNGSIAWIASTFDKEDHPSAEVRAMTAATRRTRPRGPVMDKPLLLDAGPGIDLRSLTLSADRTSVSWTRDGVRKSARLD